MRDRGSSSAAIEPAFDTGRRPAELPSNSAIARQLEQTAGLLDAQGAPAARVQQYRDSARRVAGDRLSVAELLKAHGRAGLRARLAVSPAAAAAIDEIVHGGVLLLARRLSGLSHPIDLFSWLPGIGKTLAARVHSELGADTLEEMAVLAHQGRLQHVEGIGSRRAAEIYGFLDGLLVRSTRRHAYLSRMRESLGEPALDDQPALELLLDIDAELRRRVAAGTVRTVATPPHAAYRGVFLPVLHLDVAGWALSATPRPPPMGHASGQGRLAAEQAHVVVYHERDGEESESLVYCPVASRGTPARTVRRREIECAEQADGVPRR